MAATILDEPTTVPTADGLPTTVNTGERWPAPYRGSKYSVRRLVRSGKSPHYRLVWARQDKMVHSRIPNGLLGLLRESRPEITGSIRITSHREVLCKRLDHSSGLWVPHYLGKLEGALEFDGFSLDPSGLEVGQFWRGFHFKHGETWAVWTRAGNGDYLHWSRKGVYFRSTETYPELCRLVREIRPRGGRIYITEHGHIWFNLNDKGVSRQWSRRVKELRSSDAILFRSDPAWDTLIESLSERIMVTKLHPLYLGRIEDFGGSPRTYFEKIVFSSGTKNEDQDDEDGDRSRGYRRMRRG